MRQAQSKTNMDDEEMEMEKEINENEDVEIEGRRYNEEYNNLCDFNDNGINEIDEFEELKMHLEPKYQRYAKWRI